MAPSRERGGVVPATPETIRRAADLLKNGELVVVPTETVYGVAARADSPAALARIYAAKGRDESKQIARFAAGLDGVRAAGVQVNPVAARLAAAGLPLRRRPGDELHRLAAEPHHDLPVHLVADRGRLDGGSGGPPRRGVRRRGGVLLRRHEPEPSQRP